MAGTVCVIGGGVAGIAAAAALADAGLHVELIEKRPLLGGRASSFVDKETGERVDECQHGTMRCCTNVADLLERFGVHDLIRYHETLEFLDGDGVRASISNGPLPAPFHTGISFLTFKSLGGCDKLAIGRAMIAILRAKPAPEYDALDVASWFRKMRQTDRAVGRFWRPILASACNEEPERISCSYAFMLFRTGFLSHPRAFHFGIPRVPLASLYTEPALAYLQARGACVRSRTTVERIVVESGRVSNVALVDGSIVTADHYVSAVQCDLLLKLLPNETTESAAYFRNLKGIELSPITGVHLWFDRAIRCPEALAVLDRETEWIFNKTLGFDLPPERGTYLSAVISASRRQMGAPKEEILERVLADVRACLPDARDAGLIRSHVVRWPKATITPCPGVDALRPDQRSPIPNLFVTGEWTRTGWPSTMESAARSGYRAAEYVLEDEGIPRRLVVPDLPIAPLARLIAGRRAP